MRWLAADCISAHAIIVGKQLLGSWNVVADDLPGVMEADS